MTVHYYCIGSRRTPTPPDHVATVELVVEVGPPSGFFSHVCVHHALDYLYLFEISSVQMMPCSHIRAWGPIT
jgi:hypothetical protein